MSRIKRTIEFAIFLGLAACSNGQNVPTVHQTATHSSCANIVALSGAKVDCSNLTPAQKKDLESIPAILKAALENHSYLDAILKKLNEMSQVATQTTTTNNAPGGFAVSGGTLIDPQINNFRNPLPSIEVTKSSPVPATAVPAQSSPTPRGKGPIFLPGILQHPGASVIVSVKSVFYNPAFIADCSVPCRFHALWEENGMEKSISLDYQGMGTADNIHAGVTYAKTLYPGMHLKLVFESLDDRELIVSNVKPYAP